MRLCAVRPPDVIDADLDREPVGSVGDNVLVPACLEVAGGVASDAGVDELEVQLGVAGRDECLDQRHVPPAERGVRFLTASGIGDAVSGHDDAVSLLEDHSPAPLLLWKSSIGFLDSKCTALRDGARGATWPVPLWHQRVRSILCPVTPCGRPDGVDRRTPQRMDKDTRGGCCHQR